MMTNPAAHGTARILILLFCAVPFARAQTGLIPQVPDVQQPPMGSIGNPVDNACAPVSAANILLYWDLTASHPNASGATAMLPPEVLADYLYYFMDTKNWGSPVRLNGTVLPPDSGTYTGDIEPGLFEFVRWDSMNVFTTPPPPIPPGKTGYDWTLQTDTTTGLGFYTAEIDSGRPSVLVFSYWHPIPLGPILPDPGTGELVEFYDWGPPAQASELPDPPENWIEGDGAASIGHAVTGVGYLLNFDPDSTGPIPRGDWFICHDNWPRTGVNVALPWANWEATVKINPGPLPLKTFPGVYCPGVPDNNQPPAASFACSPANFCAPVSMVNIIEYWDAVVGFSNALGTMAGMPPAVAADFVGYYMATNGMSATCGYLGRSNVSTPGTIVRDIMPGGLDYVRWDTLHPLLPQPAPGIPSGKNGYTWKANLDTTTGFSSYANTIDSCKPSVVVFRHWNPVATPVRLVDPSSNDTIRVYLQGPPIDSSWQANPADPSGIPDEVWPCALEPGGCTAGEYSGHAVTGVGYASAFDPDGTGPLPMTDWIVCHDNWPATDRNVMIEWSGWVATVSFDPFVITSVDHSTTVLPAIYILGQNYPNPFNAATVIPFGLSYAARVRIVVLNVLGQEIASLDPGTLEAGWHTVSWVADAAPSGVYFYRMEADPLAGERKSHRETRRMLLLR